MKKIVGIIGRKRNFNNKFFLVFSNELIDIIYKNNCLPLGILSDFKSSDYKKFIDMCDGIILQGGLDEYEIDNDIIKYIYDKNIPTLGICLGMQLMGKTFGGKIESLNSTNHNGTNHTIKIDKNSKLYNIIKKENILVNSRHLDNLTKTDLSISSFSENIIESIEDKNKVFFIGVQWHPESINDENSKKLFNEFFNHIKNKTSN